MTDDLKPAFQVEEDSYEGQAIRAYLEGKLSATDLLASLGVSRSHMYRLIQRYRIDGEAGLASKKLATETERVARQIASGSWRSSASITTILDQLSHLRSLQNFMVKFCRQRLYEFG